MGVQSTGEVQARRIGCHGWSSGRRLASVKAGKWRLALLAGRSSGRFLDLQRDRNTLRVCVPEEANGSPMTGRYDVSAKISRPRDLRNICLRSQTIFLLHPELPG